jgi:hypothetical protein
MFARSMRVALPLVLCCLLCATGCRKRLAANAATPDKARETLKQGLEAWKSGQTTDAVLASASITFVDNEWSGGSKLISYEVQGDGQPDGFDWQCKVKLSLQDEKGNKSEKRAVYNISTSPKLVVVRNEM